MCETDHGLSFNIVWCLLHGHWWLVIGRWWRPRLLTESCRLLLIALGHNNGRWRWWVALATEVVTQASAANTQEDYPDDTPDNNTNDHSYAPANNVINNVFVILIARVPTVVVQIVLQTVVNTSAIVAFKIIRPTEQICWEGRQYNVKPTICCVAVSLESKGDRAQCRRDGWRCGWSTNGVQLVHKEIWWSIVDFQVVTISAKRRRPINVHPPEGNENPLQYGCLDGNCAVLIRFIVERDLGVQLLAMVSADVDCLTALTREELFRI